MSRPTIKELYGIDPKEFKTECIHEFYTKRIKALKARARGLVNEMNETDDYEKLSAVNAQFKYVTKALEANKKDYEEIF
ncbi:hypothetical protein DRJ25_03965 [Candidatus Woesearchaeota archaeon]|nr:MAG: hypothetical protein DRJ25_03965 [Candidatus Woesearchaeota archaeon]